MWFLCHISAFLYTSVTIEMLKLHSCWFARLWRMIQNHSDSQTSWHTTKITTEVTVIMNTSLSYSTNKCYNKFMPIFRWWFESTFIQIFLLGSIKLYDFYESYVLAVRGHSDIVVYLHACTVFHYFRPRSTRQIFYSFCMYLVGLYSYIIYKYARC